MAARTGSGDIDADADGDAGPVIRSGPNRPVEDAARLACRTPQPVPGPRKRRATAGAMPGILPQLFCCHTERTSVVRSRQLEFPKKSEFWRLILAIAVPRNGA